MADEQDTNGSNPLPPSRATASPDTLEVDVEGLEEQPISTSSRSWSGPPPPPDTDVLVGTTLSNNYIVDRVVGEGGMGRVYEARHTRIKGKRFAIKVLHAEFLRQPEVRTRFHREAEAAALITHPNVVGVYDVDETKDGRPFLVCEFLEGEELGDRLDEAGKLTPAQTVRIVRQVCKALAAAHAQGVIHRDIKPENVFLSGDPFRRTSKVLDFGISRLEDKSARTLTKTGVVMGTPAYMSPEQARGERVDHRTDIYAVGAIMYRALTGQLPFEKDDPGATVIAVLTEEPARPRSIEPSIPEALELVLQRAMAKNPDERYQAMEELDEALAPFDLEETGMTVPGGPPPPPGSAPSAAAAARSRPGALASQTTLGQQATEIRSARPMVAMLLALGIMCTVFGLVSVISAVIRLTRGGIGAEVTLTETALVLVAVVCALTTPAVLLIRHIRQSTWDNTAKVLMLVGQLRAPMLVGIGTYGLGALLLRLSEAALLGHAMGLTWPVWDIVLFVLAVAAAGAVIGTRRLEQRQVGAGGWDRLTAIPVSIGAIVLLVAGLLAVRGGQGLGLAAALEPSAAASGSESASAPGTAPTATGAIPTATPTTAPITPSPPVALGMEQRKLVAKMRGHIGRGQLSQAVATLQQLLELTPRAAEDSEVSSQIKTLTIRALLLPERPEAGKMLELLSSGMGTAGIDILYNLYTTRGGTIAAKESGRLLADEKIRARGSPALRIAWDLRAARGCEETLVLLDRAKREGDKRAINELRLVKNCRRRHAGSCCLPRDKRIKAAIDEIAARL